MAKVLLADDHALIRSGLRNALAALPNLEIVGEVGNGAELIESLERCKPDLLVMDVTMPDFEPISAVGRFKEAYPELKILVVSAYDDEAYVVGLLESGVDGYQLKDQPLTDLQLAVQRILDGNRWISGPLIDRLVHRKSKTSNPNIPVLTKRQRELLRLLMQGFDNRKIAKAMELSVKTVENHLTGLYRLLGVDNRLGALNCALRHPEILALPAHEAQEPRQQTATSMAVLLVDDNPRYREQLSRLIAKTYPNAWIHEADDMVEALRLAEKIHPPLAFIDVVLEEEDGIQCARRLKTISPATRVVLISAYPDREFRRMGLAAGAIAFLDKKDIDAAAVRQVLEDTIQREKKE